MGVFLGLLNFQILFGVLDIPDILGVVEVGAGSKPMYKEKMRVPPTPLIGRIG